MKSWQASDRRGLIKEMMQGLFEEPDIPGEEPDIPNQAEEVVISDSNIWAVIEFNGSQVKSMSSLTKLVLFKPQATFSGPTSQLTVDIPCTLHKQFKQTAVRLGRSMRSLVNGLVGGFINDVESNLPPDK